MENNCTEDFARNGEKRDPPTGTVAEVAFLRDNDEAFLPIFQSVANSEERGDLLNHDVATS